MKLILIILSLLTCPFSYASAAAATSAKMKLPPLKVTWNDNLDIKYIGITGDKAQLPLNKPIIFQRYIYPSQKLKLLIIFNDKDLAPLTLPISNQTSQINIKKEQAQSIHPDSLWLWGETPSSPCGGMSQLHFRFLQKKSLYKNHSGFFAWEIKKKLLPKYSSFYISPQFNIDFIKSISSQVFLPASDIDKAACQIHHGGFCPFVFILDQNEKLHLHKINFKMKKLDKMNFICPV